MKKENLHFIQFLKFYMGKIGKNDFVAIHERTKEKTPDYYIPSINTLVEIKEIHDRKDLERHSQWSIIANKLQKAIDSSPIINKVKGSYLIDTPHSFKSPTDTKSFEEAANNIINAVLNSDKETKVFNCNFEINKVSEEGGHIVFGTTGPGGSFDAAQTIFENIYEKIKTANSQLNFKHAGKSQKKKLVLLVNKYQLLFWDWDLYKGMSYFYEDLISYTNIDEIWFQKELKNGKFSHQLVYKRSFFEQFESGCFKKYDSNDLNLFENWFSSLESKSDEKKEKLLIALKIFLKDKEGYQVFKNIIAREEMVRFGRWLIENKKYDDAIWLIEKFINDPDPENKTTSKDSETNLHEIIKNEDGKQSIHSITSVLGHLAWTVQSLAVRKQTIYKAYELTKYTIKRTKNLYVVLQWLFPLIEISNRRFYLKEIDNNSYEDLKKLCFFVLNKYSKYPALSEGIVHIFNYFRELTTEEAITVLSSLKDSKKYEVLLIYYAIFRQRHYTEEKYDFSIRNYKAQPAQTLLKNTITDISVNNYDIRSGIAWNFWKILTDSQTEFGTLKFWICEFMKYPLEPRIIHNFERIVEEWFEREPNTCMEWYLAIIESLKNYIQQNPTKARDIWLTNDTDKILINIAKYFPIQLLLITQNLFEIWKAGSYIGSLKDILKTYEYIEDKNLQEKIKNNNKTIYESMKKLNPKLEEVIF